MAKYRSVIRFLRSDVRVIASELTVVVLPFTSWWNLFNRVPVFDNAAISNAVEIVECTVGAAARAFALGEDEIALGENAMDVLVVDVGTITMRCRQR